MKKNLLIALAAAGLTLASCGTNTTSTSTSTSTSASTSVSTQESSTSEEAKLAFTDGYYQFAFGNEGSNYNFWFHFYDNGIFYYQQMNNKGGIGYWTLTDDQWTGQYAKTRDDKVNNNYVTNATFAKTLKLTTVAGKDAGTAGYDEATDSLYGFTSSVFATYGQQQVYTHFAEKGSDWGDEAACTVCEYQSQTSASCKVTINHDGTYNDLMGEYLVEGTWAKDGNTYTLTPDDKTDTGAVMVVAENAKTATYTPDGGTAQTLDTTAAPASIVYTYVDDGNNGEGYTITYGSMTMALEVKVEFYDDGSAVVTKYVGTGKNESVSDGSWSPSDDGIGSCNLEGNGISDFGTDGSFTLTVSGVSVKMVKPVTELLVATSDTSTLTFYDDLTFTASLYSGAAKVTGTWDMPKYTLTITPDGTSTTATAATDSSTYDMTVTFAFTSSPATVAFTLARADWGSKLVGHTAAPKELVTNTQGTSTITFYDNKTYACSFYGGQGGTCTGTWNWASTYSFAVTVDEAYAEKVTAGTPELSSAGLAISFTLGGSNTVTFTLTTEEWQKTK